MTEQRMFHEIKQKDTKLPSKIQQRQVASFPEEQKQEPILLCDVKRYIYPKTIAIKWNGWKFLITKF